MTNFWYHVQFHSDWHCGSGTGAGADLDAVVLRDADGLPYLPGKTIKGLLRDAANDLQSFGDHEISLEFIAQVFGLPDDRTLGQSETQLGFRAQVHFSDAALTQQQAEVVGKSKDRIFRKIARTAIGEDGQVCKHSLRRVEVVIPLRLTAKVFGLQVAHQPALRKCMSYIKQLGAGRTRGLGRCTLQPGSK